MFELLFEIDFEIFAESWRVVVSSGFSVAKRLQQRIRFQNLLCDYVARSTIHLMFDCWMLLGVCFVNVLFLFEHL